MRILVAIFLLSLPVMAQADKRILLPDGRGCWQNDVGHVYGCDPVTQAPAQAPAQAPSKSSAQTPATCIQVEAELAKVKRKLRSGYGSNEGTELRAKRRKYQDLLRKYCK